MAPVTLRQQLQGAIDRQTEELKRIESTRAEQAAATQKRLDTLNQAMGALTPQIEALLLALASVGVTMTFKEQ